MKIETRAWDRQRGLQFTETSRIEKRPDLAHRLRSLRETLDPKTIAILEASPVAT
jgi:hypothetical protein